MKYKVKVKDNSWTETSSGETSPIFIRECGHQHRTVKGATRCLNTLTKRLSDGMYDARWYHAKIYDSNDQEVHTCY